MQTPKGLVVRASGTADFSKHTCLMGHFLFHAYAPEMCHIGPDMKYTPFLLRQKEYACRGVDGSLEGMKEGLLSQPFA